MRFIVDECTGPRVAKWLQQQGYEVYSVYDEAPGSTDDKILDKACTENWVLITNDKDSVNLSIVKSCHIEVSFSCDFQMNVKQSRLRF